MGGQIDLPRERLTELLDSGMNVRDMAKELKVSKTIVYRRLHLHGLMAQARIAPPSKICRGPDRHDLTKPENRAGRNCRLCQAQRAEAKARQMLADGRRSGTWSREQTIQSARAVHMIGELTDRLTQLDYSGPIEREEIKAYIANLGKLVIL